MKESLTTEPEMHEGTLAEDGAHCDSHECWCWDDRYQIVTRHSAKELSEAVNAFIHQKGWIPLGGVNCSIREGTALWAQAMERHNR